MLFDRLKGANKFLDLVVYSFLVFAIFGVGIRNFDFWSDDFGYFLSFHKIATQGIGLRETLASYLTGGVPRLQLGWHLTHQILFLIFGTKTIWYYIIQSIVLVLNSFLLCRLMRPYFGEVVSFWSGVFLIVCPFYRESFYWVSANYGFFQVLFFLFAWFFLDRSLYIFGLRRGCYLTLSSVFLVLSCLFQEQSITFLGLLPITFVLMKLGQGVEAGSRKSIIFSAIKQFSLGVLIFALLYAPQLFVIKGASSTSLSDTIHSYYPHPIQSLKSNIPLLLRWTFLGWIPDFIDFSEFISHYSQISHQFKIKMLVAVFLGFIAAILALIFSSRSRSSKINRVLLFGCLVWWLGASIVVMPLVEYLSRYVYVVLPPALLFAIAMVVRLGRFGRFALAVLAFLCVVDISSFFYGSFFQLVNVERRSFHQVANELRNDPNIKGVVFEDFPAALNRGRSGVWINYHATNWWLKWRALPGTSQHEIVGNALTQQGKTPFGPSGFRLTYMPYPLERLRKVYQPGEILVASFIGNAYEHEPRIRFTKRLPFKARLIDKPVKVSERRNRKDVKLPASLTDLRGCSVDVVATVAAKNTLAALTMFDGNGVNVTGGSAFSSGLEKGESKIFFRAPISTKGPYFLRISNQPNPTQPPSSESWSVQLKKLHIFGCGEEYVADQFLENHNPNPSFPLLRYANPQMNYSVILPYPDAQMWEVPWSVGINDVLSSGDYYCYPDDRVWIQDAKGNNFSAYVGMLSFRREIEKNENGLLVAFTRKHGDPMTRRGQLDRMPKDEFDGYARDDLPIDIEAKHQFFLDRNYGLVNLKLKSQSKVPIRLRWVFEDSAVFDFKYFGDEAVSTLILSSGEKNKEFRSSRSPINRDISINHMIRYPLLPNIGALDYSWSPYRGGSFLSGKYTKQSFETFPQNTITYGDAIPENQAPPHRVHGLWFDITLQPGETRHLEYAKLFLSGWYDREELKSWANKTIDQVERDLEKRKK